MSIRLDTVQTLGRNLKNWGKRTAPLICLARYLSDRPVDWFFFWIGWKVLCTVTTTSTSFLFGHTNTRPFRGGARPRARPRALLGNAGRHKAAEDCYSRNNCNDRIRVPGSTSTSTSKLAHIPLTSLPSVVLSNVACYLHARDVLALDIVVRSSTIRNADHDHDHDHEMSRTYGEVILHDVWKRLWYRDYGDVLLKWKVSREAFRRSLLKSLPQSTTKGLATDEKCGGHSGGDDGWLEERLSNRLDEFVTNNNNDIRVAAGKAMKTFYFVFGECYIDYVLAGKNTVDECYLGLHGHIFDFTDFAEYHPGLIEPILKECGGDATYFFEDLPHSSGARNIARRLCVMVNHDAIRNGNSNSNSNETESSSRRLELVVGADADADAHSSELKRVLRSSNTRPPPPTTTTTTTNSNDTATATAATTTTTTTKKEAVDRDRNRWMPHVVPRRRKLRKHPTVERIRARFEHNESAHRNMAGPKYLRFWLKKGREKYDIPKSRVYFDPLLQKWIRWNP
eukprot:jgi/Psemu1/5767/gm1.5767_g